VRKTHTLAAGTALLALVLACPAFALMVEMSPAEMSAHSDLVVDGTVTGLASHWDETHNMIYTDVTVAVTGFAKRPAGADAASVVVRMPGGEVGETGIAVGDMPTFVMGEQVRLHLTRTPTPGVYELLGGGQGKLGLDPGRSVDALWSYSGIHWRTDICPLYYINTGLPTDWRTANNAGATAWSNAGSMFGIYSGGTTSRTAPTQDGVSVVYRTNMGGGGTLARTTVWYNTSTKLISECDMVYNTYYPFATNGGSGYYDVQNIGTHELGHFLMLNDLYTSDAIEQTMYGYASKGETKKRSLESGDKAGIKYIYGTRFGDGGNAGRIAARPAVFRFPGVTGRHIGVRFTLDAPTPVHAEMYNAAGIKVAEARTDGAAEGCLHLDAGTNRAGVYLVKATASNHTAVGKVVISP
jgi:hypothetical protein